MANKVEEKIHLEWFLKQEAIPCTNLQDHEKPDFLVQIDSQIIGIEVTNLYLEANPGDKGSKAKKGEALRKKWLQKLATRYYKQHSTPIRLSLSARPSELEEFTDIILEALSNCDEIPLWEHVRKEIELPTGKRCIANILRLPPKFSKYSRWEYINDHISFVGDISPEHIFQALKKKEPKVTTYLQSCNKTWLLLVADSTWNSGIFTVPSHLPTIPESGFEKIWLLNYPKSVHLL